MMLIFLTDVYYILSFVHTPFLIVSPPYDSASPFTFGQEEREGERKEQQREGRADCIWDRSATTRNF